MTKQSRNTDRIVQLAKEKRRNTKINVEKIITKMSLEGKTINFNNVAKEANVSKSWLYKEVDVRKRIEELRNRQIQSNATIPKNKKTSRSEEVLIRTLRERIKALEKENLSLKNQIEKLYGDLYSRD